MEPSRWWGDDRAILDDEEARRRILDAAGRCIVRRGNTQFRMGEVADEAGVSRSTVYRYFPGRDDVLLGLMLMRVDKALGDLVRSLPAPDDPVRSVPEMVLARVESVDGNPLNEALFAAESTGVATALEKGSATFRGAVAAALRTLAESVEAGGASLRRSRFSLDRPVAAHHNVVFAGAIVAVPSGRRQTRIRRAVRGAGAGATNQTITVYCLKSRRSASFV